MHPMVKLQNYITKYNLKLIDFFRRFDLDGNMNIGYSEFKEGLEVSTVLHWSKLIKLHYSDDYTVGGIEIY